MLKALAVLLWPVGIGAILVVTALLVRHRRDRPRHVAMNGHGDAAVTLRGARSSIVGMLLILAVGALAVYAVTCLLGVLVVHAAPGLDKSIYTWMTGHQAHVWKAVMNRLTKIGNTWTTWGAAAAAAACLAAFYRRHKWLPPVALGAAIVIDHYLTLALRHTFHRPGPPDSPLGTFPSGGCDRIIVFYGLIAYLIWREVSGRKSTAVWLAGVVAVLAFSEAYSRVYLTLHWFTDAVSGLIYGCLILAVFIATIRLVEGPAAHRAGQARGRPVAEPAPARAVTLGAASATSATCAKSCGRRRRRLRSAPAARPRPAADRDFLVLPSASRPRLLVPSARRAAAAALRRYGEPGSARAWRGQPGARAGPARGRGPAGLGGRLRVRAAPGADTIEAYLAAACIGQRGADQHAPGRGPGQPQAGPPAADRARRHDRLRQDQRQPAHPGPDPRRASRPRRPRLRPPARADRAAGAAPRAVAGTRGAGDERAAGLAPPHAAAPRPAGRGHDRARRGGRPRPRPPGHQRLPGPDHVPAGTRSRPGRTGTALAAALGALAAADPELSFGAWHGDWTGWNMASTRRRAAGLGLGAVHPARSGSASTPCTTGCSPPWSAGASHRRQAAADIVTAAPRALAPFGVPAAEARLTGLLYLAELSVRYLSDRQAEVGARLGRPGTWLIPAIEEAL